MSGWNDLAGLLVVRPLTRPLPGPSYGGGYSSPFSASWSSTVQLLAGEIRHLEPREVILEAGFDETQLRLDGFPRATARANTEGVVLTLIATKHGHDLRYPCPTFWRWQDNVRAIALALEALRKVDRYGVSPGGEQYAGWKALPAAGGTTTARGGDLIREHGGLRAALMATHPDRGGDPEDFAAVQAAKDAGAK